MQVIADDLNKQYFYVIFSVAVDSDNLCVGRGGLCEIMLQYKLYIGMLDTLSLTISTPSAMTRVHCVSFVPGGRICEWRQWYIACIMGFPQIN
jgi:hypothetical protein